MVTVYVVPAVTVKVFQTTPPPPPPPEQPPFALVLPPPPPAPTKKISTVVTFEGVTNEPVERNS
jgi:hypothetical protein